MNPARHLAFRSLTKYTLSGTFADLELDAILKSEADSLSPEDRALYAQLFFGVIERKISLDYLLSRLSSVPFPNLKTEAVCILELGAYQILYLDRIPDRAAVFEAGELAKKYCKDALSLINAVLRRIAREKEGVLSLLDQPGKKGLSLRYGFPRWMIRLWQESYGKETCLSILKAQNTRAPLTLRINTLKTTVEEYTRLLSKAGISYHRNPLCKHGITLEKSFDVRLLPQYDEGFFFIQDAAAQHAIDRLGALPNEKILDLCASPGGKSFAAAMDMNGQGEVLSLELYPFRLPKIREGAARLGISILTARENDSSKIRPDLSGLFDRVICDVPCSGYGVIAKKPDIRHKKEEEAHLLPELQLSILEAGADALKPGGVILYSTCTLNPSENEMVTEAFLACHPEFSRIGESETIFPVGGENDGFFCDLLEKTR